MEFYHKAIKVNSRTFTLRPFGDLQKGDPGFREDIWATWKREMIEDPNSYAIGMGDYSNSFRPTIRKNINKVMQEDSEAAEELENMVKLEMEKLADEMKPFAKKIIGLLEGHHYSRLRNCTSTQYLCDLLGTKYLGFECMIKLDHYQNHTLDIFATHGCGGSVFTATDVANLERKIMPFWDADIFLRGHSSKLYAVAGAPLNYMVLHNGKLRRCQKQRLLINTGAFMEGYTEGRTSYVEEKNLPPAALGYASIDIHRVNRHGREDMKNVEMIPRFYSPGSS